MINHARTLLLNVRGSTSSRESIGEEYIPPNYTPTVLPTYLQTLRRILFGAAPDRYFLNFRAHELLAHLHTTELGEYVYALDPRVTYWPEQTLPFYDTEKRVTVAQSAGPAAPAPTFQGDLFADNARGRSVREFTLNVTVENTAWTAYLTSPDTPTANHNTPMTFTNGLSNLLPIGTTGLAVKVPQPNGAITWQIYTRVKPTTALTAVLPLLELAGEPIYIDLFGVGMVAEPYSTFKQLWFDHPNPVYRLGGLTLAIIYRTNEVLLSAAGHTV
jgi:hypothetical protein